MNTYEVNAGYDGTWWVFDVPALSSQINHQTITARGQARRAGDVAHEARGLISMWTDTPEEDITLSVSYTLPERIGQAIDHARTQDTQASQAAREAAQARRFAARSLIEQGMSKTDAATVLGISRQRVQQLLSA